MTTLPDIKVFDTLTSKKESLKTKTPGKVTIYGCGPTVYGYAHVGNAKTAISMDLMRRILTYAGYKVVMARNVTDVDDKIIKAAQDAGKEWHEITREFTDAYNSEMRGLNIAPPDHEPRATDHIPEMVKIISGLVEKELAYPAETPYGTDVYFRVKKDPNYGCLSHRKPDDMLSGARIEPGEMKEDPLDFALWKAAKPGEPSWESPWGQGRPGWHIECSAMIHALFGTDLDVHAGGLDLIFPHHENEVSQSVGYTGKPIAHHWLHSGLVNFGREKMSKSLGNIVRTKDFLENYSGEVLRMLVAHQHYRSPVDYSDESLLRSEGLVDRLYSAKAKVLEAGTGAKTAIPGAGTTEELKAKIDASLFDEFNTAKALGFILSSARACFRENKPEIWRAWGEACLVPLNQAFGIVHLDPAAAMSDIRCVRLKRMGVDETYCKAIEATLKSREDARAAKDFAASDRIRGELEAKGILVMDGPDGSTWAVAPKA